MLTVRVTFSLVLFSELSGLFHEVHQSGEHGNVTWLKTHFLDLRQTGQSSVRILSVPTSLNRVFTHVCALVQRHIPVPPGIPRPAPAEVGSCCHLWVPHLLPSGQLWSHLFWLASVVSSSPPSFSLSLAPLRLSHSIWTEDKWKKQHSERKSCFSQLHQMKTPPILFKSSTLVL